MLNKHSHYHHQHVMLEEGSGCDGSTKEGTQPNSGPGMLSVYKSPWKKWGQNWILKVIFRRLREEEGVEYKADGAVSNKVGCNQGATNNSAWMQWGVQSRQTSERGWEDEHK